MRKIMKRMLTCFGVLILAGGCLPGCSPVEKPVRVEYSQLYKAETYVPDPNNATTANIMGGESLHYAPDGYLGDVHPFYYNGKMYMFYMSTGMEKGSRHTLYESMLAISEDMIHYTTTPLVMDPDNPPDQDVYYAPLVYVDAEGRFRSVYGRNDFVAGCVSDDLVTWSAGIEPYLDEETGMLRYKYRITFDDDVVSGRDPYIWYDTESETYYCVVLNYYTKQRETGAKSLALYTGTKDGIYSSKATKLLNFTDRGDPECPQLMPIGNRWYLFYSVLGTGTGGGVGNLCYRVGGENELPQDVDWESAKEYRLDGGDLHAAQLVYVEDKLYMYGWINYTPHMGVWGGFLNIPREIYQNEDGTLSARCDEYLTELLKKDELGQIDGQNTSVQNLVVEGSKFVSTGEGQAVANETYGRIMLTAKVTLPLDAYQGGITVSEGSRTYFAGIRRMESGLYLSVKADGEEPGTVWVPILDPNQTEFELKVILDNGFIEAFTDDRYAVTAHTKLISSTHQLGLRLDGENTTCENIQIYQLATYYDIFE